MDLMTWLQSQSAAQFLFWFIASISLIAIVTKSWKGITGFVVAVNAVTELASFMKDTRAELRVIKHEVLPNSGSSLRDAVDRYHESMIKQEQRIDEIEESLQSILKEKAK